jgi:hypothetical protein
MLRGQGIEGMGLVLRRVGCGRRRPLRRASGV